MSTSYCKDCGSRICNHGNCSSCRPCAHCYYPAGEPRYLDETLDYEAEKERDRDFNLDGWGSS